MIERFKFYSFNHNVLFRSSNGIVSILLILHGNLLVDWSSADWARVLTLLYPASDALGVEEMLVVAVQFRDHIVLCIFVVANDTL